MLELKGPIGVNRFRIFLNSRGCAKLVSFWMDCERFLLLTDDEARKEAFNAIEILYLKVKNLIITVLSFIRIETALLQQFIENSDVF